MPRMAKPTTEILTVAVAVDRWEQSMKASDSKSAKTIAVYVYAGRLLAAHVGAKPINHVTSEDHEALLTALKDRKLKPASRATIYRSLRAFWKWVVASDAIPKVKRDPMNGLTQPTIPETKIKYPDDADVRKIIATTKDRSRHNYRGRRDEAILRLLASTGARLSEIANLTLVNVDLIANRVTVMGKGRRERDLPLDAATASALRRYLERERPRHPSAGTTDRVWLGPAGVMTSNGIAQMVVQRGKDVGVAIHPHLLRHRFIGKALGAGMSEGDVMSLSGHRSRSMLDRYSASTRADRAHESFRKLTESGAIPKL